MRCGFRLRLLLAAGLFLLVPRGKLAAQEERLDVMVGGQVREGFDMGLDTDTQKRTWALCGPEFCRFDYPAGQAWGAVFLTAGPVTPATGSRKTVNVVKFASLFIEMRSSSPGSVVKVGLKTEIDPDDGREPREDVYLSSEWQTITIPLTRFNRPATLSHVYIVTELVFSGASAQNLDVRNIRFTTLPAVTVESVVSAASFLPALGVGSWITIRGKELAFNVRPWGDSDFNGPALPKSLDGAVVAVNNKAIPVAYISGVQINALLPSDFPPGTARLVVTNQRGTSLPASISVQAYAPAFFTFSPENGRYAAAIHADGGLACKPELYSPCRQVQPSETLLLFGTGFGPTVPAVSNDVVFQGAAPLANPGLLHIRIGGVEARAVFAGLIGVGLYQFNVEVPQAPDGDQRLIADIAGTQTQTDVFLTIKR